MASLDMNRLMDNARIKLPGALDGTLQLELVNVLIFSRARTSGKRISPSR